MQRQVPDSDEIDSLKVQLLQPSTKTNKKSRP
jgi:hypothetical protein